MGTKATLAERDLRYRRTREAMEREGISALIVAGHASHFRRGYIRYLTDTHMWAGDALLLLPLEGEPTLAWVSYAGSGWPDELWVTDVRKAPYPETRIVDAMKAARLTRGKVGIAGLNRVMTVRALQTLRGSLPDVDFVSGDLLMDGIRLLKSPLELQQYRETWDVGRRALARFEEVVAPGVSQREAASAADHVIRANGSFDDLTKIRDGAFDNLAKDVPLRCDDLVSLHLEFCGESGHWIESDITLAFREPTKLELKMMETELIAYDVVRKMAKPGVWLSDMAKTFDQVVEDQGWKLGDQAWHFYFHGHGMDDIERPWYTNMVEGNEDVILEEGLVLNYHPHRLTIPDVPNYPRITDDIVITKNGAERLSGDWDFRWRIKK